MTKPELRINDESQMTNSNSVRISVFGFDSSFRSSFVIQVKLWVYVSSAYFSLSVVIKPMSPSQWPRN